MSNISLREYRRAQEGIGLRAFERIEGFAQNISKLWRRYLELRDRRDAFLNLQRLDDRMLADIGLERADVEWAADLPLEMNAAQELDALRRARKLAALPEFGRGIARSKPRT